MKQDVEPAFMMVKKLMHKLIVFFLATLVTVNVSAQQDIPVGSWRTHNAYNKTIALTSNGTDLIAATNSAIYTYNPTQNTSEQITKITGLSDAEITAVGYNINQGLTAVTYANGNIDLISTTKISNFRDLLLADIQGSKRINHVYSFEDYLYLSADFGVMIIDLEKMEVKESYFELGADGSTVKVYSSTILNDTIYLATDEGIIGGYLGDNLKDFNQWRRYGVAEGMPEATAKVIVKSGAGLLAAFDQDGLYEYNNGNWLKKNLLENEVFRTGSFTEQSALLVTENEVYRYSAGSVELVESDLILEPRSAIFMNNEIVIGDFFNGLVFPANQSSFYPNGPLSNDITRLFGYLDKMVALPRAFDNGFTPLRGNAGFFIFDEGEWVNYNNTGSPGTIMIPEVLDFSDAMYSYTSKSLFLSSYGYGVLELKDDLFTLFDDTNSTLVNSSPPGKNIFVTALDASSRALTAVNFNTTNPYQRLDLSTGGWNSWPIGSNANYAVQIRGFENNTSWLRIAPDLGGKIVVYDNENQFSLQLDKNHLPSERVNDMVIDRDGKMWVATDKGVVYFYNAENILNQVIIDPVKPIYDGQILFRNEKLTALAVDGGNRIWMATTSGVWLFASDGFELIYNFNAQNSPLPSNNIYDISINHQSGEVFFATEAGLVSFRADATISTVEEPLKIFPNPALRSQHDIVTIQGVPTDADFWITDSSGRLVYRSTAVGNTATWSGISGNSQLSSGVYFVFVSTEEGDQKQVGKIALIN